MSIDLSKAKLGDKFRTRGGLVLTYYKEYINRGVHILKKEGGMTTLFLENGNYMVGGDMHPLDLVEQVFDDEKGRAIADKILKDVETVVNGVAEAMPLIESSAIANLLRKPLPENNEYIDLLDNSISVEERGQVIAQMAKNEYEKAKELGFAIQNLPYIVEQPKEDNPELQRRQEVVELADRIFFSERGSVYSFKECIEVAEHSVNVINQYLKEGKL